MFDRLVILHHHLRRGGVTQVIVNHLLALDAVVDHPVEVLILQGGEATGMPDDLATRLRHLRLSIKTAKPLDYDDGPPEPQRLAGLVNSLLGDAQFHPDATLIHVHNHSLGKNASFPGALRLLAETGYRILLQIHDFAEDFRPENYRRLGPVVEEIYPTATHVHYAVLNSRDANLLQSAGIEDAQLHLLPNPVKTAGRLPDARAARAKAVAQFGWNDHARFLIYPVRAIRRKNLGETLLWAAAGCGMLQIGVTLAPQNPIERPAYEHWRALADELQLPVTFGIGETGGLGFLENLAAADTLLTTSVAEGFGMVFLESWLAGRPLVGRDLPEITQDFTAAGIHLDGLASRLLVPVEWCGEDRFVDEFVSCFAGVLDDYRQPRPPDLSDRVRGLIENGCIDFAQLTRRLQSDVIRHVAENVKEQDRLRELNPAMQAAMQPRDDEQSLVQQNATAVERFASLRVAGARLTRAYETLRRAKVSNKVVSTPNPGRVLDGFLSLDRFHPLRVEP